jgi:hypothetical protein
MGSSAINQKFSSTDLFLPLNVFYEFRIQIEYASFRRIFKGIQHHDIWYRNYTKEKQKKGDHDVKSQNLQNLRMVYFRWMKKLATKYNSKIT